jgi:hypothetical protein
MPGTLDEINCFISYHRPDNRDYLNVVDRLKAEISGRFEASTGRTLNIFLDRDAIGWGEDWRERIRDSVLATTFFIPIITMRFFRSDACREELTTYYENAKQLGVTELILPVVLAGASQISATHVNEDVRLIERLNYIPIEAEWEAGYESPAWRAIVNRMVNDLTRALAKAEESLEMVDLADADAESVGEFTGTEADLGSLTESIHSTTTEMTQSMTSMQALGGILTEATANLKDDASPAERQAALIKAAKPIGEAASVFAEVASRFERSATETDTQLRGVIRELRSIDTETSQSQLDLLISSAKGLPALGDSIVSIDDALAGLRLVSIANVAMRKALQPAIRAMQSMRIGMSIAIGWGEL